MIKRILSGIIALCLIIITICPCISVFANDTEIVPVDDNTYLPTEYTEQDYQNGVVEQLITGILKNGGSLDLTQYIPPNPVTDNPTNDLYNTIFENIINGATNLGIEQGTIDTAWDYVFDWFSLGSIAANTLLPVNNTFLNLLAYWGESYIDAYSIYNDLNATPTPTPDPSPQPSPDFSFIQNINNFYNKNGINLLSDTFNLYDNNTRFYFGKGDIKNATICSDNFVSESAHTGGNPNRSGTKIYSLTDICTINVDTLVSPITVTYTNSTIYNQFIYKISNPNNYYYSSVTIQETKNNLNDIEINPFQYSTTYFQNSPYNRSTFDSLSTCMNYLYQHYANINLYVDGVPWALSNYSPVTPSIPSIIGIGGNTYLENIPNTPIQVNIPDDSYIDVSQLRSIITTAINNSSILKWEDIADAIVDINGNTVVCTYNIVRNDDDNLYVEQYEGILLPEFNKNLITNNTSAIASINTMKTVVSETTDILPTEIKQVLVIGGILTLFACIINRLSE